MTKVLYTDKMTEREKKLKPQVFGLAWSHKHVTARLTGK